MRRFVMLVASVAAVVVLGAVAVWTQLDGASTVSRVHRGDREQLQSTLAGLTSQYLQFTFLSSKNAADTAAWTLNPGDPRDRAALQTLVRTSPLTSYGAAVVSLTGQPLTAYPSLSALPAPTDAGYAPMRRDLLAGQPGLSDVMTAERGVPVVAFAVPIERAGHVVGLLVTYADVRQWPLQGYDASLRVDRGARSMVVDRTGRLVAATDVRSLGQQLPGLPVRALAGGTGITTATVGGARSLVSFGPAGHGWTALTVQPPGAFSGVLDRSRNIAVLALAALLSGAVVLLIVFHHKRQQALARLADERLFDPVTGLGQRGVFQMRLDAALARRRRHGGALAVLYCDLDRFKAVNDQHGHNTGDKLLAAVATRIATAIRDTDMAVRLGGDEFAVVMEEASADEASDVADRIRRAVAAPLTLQGNAITTSISIGGAVVVTGDARADELLHEADLAMYQAKRAGDGCKIVVTSGTALTPSPRTTAEPAAHVVERTRH